MMYPRGKKGEKRYSRIDYNEPIETRDGERESEEYEGKRPYRCRFNKRRYSKPYHRYNTRRFIRKPFVVEVVFTEDATSLQLPERKTTKSAGADLKALFDGTIPAHGMLTGVRTGVKIKIPNEGTVGWITPRSGMSSKGITIINAPGEIDSDYRGELLINFANLSDEDFTFKAGERIAQITFCPIRKGNFTVVPEFSPDKFENERGEGGFGSTGMSDKPEEPVEENKDSE